MFFHLHGIAEAVSVICWFQLCKASFQKQGLDPESFSHAAPWAALAAIVGAHVVYLLFHSQAAVDAWSFAAAVNGQSALGAAVGGGAVALFMVGIAYRGKVCFRDLLCALTVGVPPALLIARGGCSLVGDTLGNETDSAFAVTANCVDGRGNCHNLAFYEAVGLLVYCAAFYQHINARLVTITFGLYYSALRLGLFVVFGNGAGYRSPEFLYVVLVCLCCTSISVAAYRSDRTSP